jgi:hypothetical protein
MFNISEFKARMDRHGGPGRSSLFEVAISATNRRGEIIVPGVISTDDLRFFCQTVSMPGINLEVMSYKPSGIGFSESMPMNSSPDQLNAVFMLDSNHRVITYFHRWISSVVNISGNRGDNVNGLAPKLIEYKDAYSASELTIRHYSTHNPFQFYECRYEGVYPTQVSPIDLSWASNDSPATTTVNFSYNRMIYSGFSDTNFETSSTFIGRQRSQIRGNTITQTIQSFDSSLVDDLTSVPFS